MIKTHDTATIASLPKAELHVHLEGTITPKKAQMLAAKNGLNLNQDLFNDDLETYTWTDDGTAPSALVGFLKAYDMASQTIRTAEDYADITHDYLMRSAEQGVIYTELTISADHGAGVGITYPQMVNAIAKGAEQAKQDSQTNIECRLISSCVRHYGIEQALNVADITVANPHPLVTGFTMAGDENAHDVIDFKPAFDIAKRGGLNLTAHAGEARNVQSIKDVHTHLGCTRYGHMVRLVEDPAFMQYMRDQGAVPEICISSNLALNVYPNYDTHPLHQFWEMGFPVTLSSDDPPFFQTHIGREYQIAHDHFGLGLDDLLQVTDNALNAAFLDRATRQRLLNKTATYKQQHAL